MSNSFLNQFYTIDQDTGDYIIEIGLNDYNDVFNTWDSSVYNIRDLDTSLKTFLEDCFQDIHPKNSTRLRLNLMNEEKDPKMEKMVIRGIRNYFNYSIYTLKKDSTIKRKRTVLYIFTSFILIISSFYSKAIADNWVISELVYLSLTVGSWVFLWEAFSLLFIQSTEMRKKKKQYEYLLKKGLLSHPPYVTMPESVKFVKSKSYLSGNNPFKRERSLNTVEVGHMYQTVEANVVGMQMITGFAQCAEDQDVKNYFKKGVELAKSANKEFSDMLLQDGIQAPVTSGGNPTRSTVAPFSDKIMMYCVSLFCSFSLGKNALGTAFSMRSDLPAKGAVFSKDVFEYAQQGAKIMIDKGWMEEPPQMEERDELMS